MTATIEPTSGLYVKEFSINAADSDAHSTYYIDASGGDMRFKLVPRGSDFGGIVSVLLGLDGSLHEVHVDGSGTGRNGLGEFEAMTKAAEEILRVRDHLLKMHGYSSIEECRAAAPSATCP